MFLPGVEALSAYRQDIDTLWWLSQQRHNLLNRRLDAVEGKRCVELGLEDQGSPRKSNRRLGTGAGRADLGGSSEGRTLGSIFLGGLPSLD